MQDDRYVFVNVIIWIITAILCAFVDSVIGAWVSILISNLWIIARYIKNG